MEIKICSSPDLSSDHTKYSGLQLWPIKKFNKIETRSGSDCKCKAHTCMAYEMVWEDSMHWVCFKE